MVSRWWMMRCAVATLAIAGSSLSIQAEEISLFNGRSLEGWTFTPDDKEKEFDIDNVWRAKQGMLLCSGMPHGILQHKGQFENYMLSLEWRWLPSIAGTTAVFIHTTEGKGAFSKPKAIEVSLFRNNAGDVYFRGHVDSRQDADQWVFKRQTVDDVEHEMGEWNQLQVICRGQVVTVVVNGRVVNQVKGYPDRKGSIALECRGTPVFFRNMKLQTPLPESAGKLEASASQVAKQFAIDTAKRKAASLAERSKREAADLAMRQAAEQRKKVIERSWPNITAKPEFAFQANVRAVPVPTNAQNLEFQATVKRLEYATPSSLTAMTHFYRTEMIRRGWKETERDRDDDTVELTYQHEDAEAEVELDSGRNGVEVTISTQGLSFDGANDPAALAALGIPQPQAYLVLQKTFTLPTDLVDLEYTDGNTCSFKSSSDIQTSFDTFASQLRNKGFRESRRPIITKTRRYSEFTGSGGKVSVNVFEHKVGSRVILELAR